MNLLQTWIVFGVPGLAIAAGLFVGRSMWRAWLGYAVLAALMLVFLLVPGDAISGAAVGLVAFVLVANGRGTARDRAPEHHEHRERFTVDPSHA